MVSFRGQKKAWPTPRLVSYKGLFQIFRRASPPLHMQTPPLPSGFAMPNLFNYYFSKLKVSSTVFFLYSPTAPIKANKKATLLILAVFPCNKYSTDWYIFNN